MRNSTKVILGLTERSSTDFIPVNLDADDVDVGFIQRQAKKMIKAGDSVERAILDLAKQYGLSMHDCELLHLALAR